MEGRSFIGICLASGFILGAIIGASQGLAAIGIGVGAVIGLGVGLLLDAVDRHRRRG